MRKTSSFLIVKFGKREHLEQLQKGEIFFNAIETYRNDGTDYRGDSMEGRIPIDPAGIKIYDKEGKDILEKFPRPDIAYEGLVGDENSMMFCAAAITTEILDNVSGNTWHFKEDFKSAIKNFGEYALLIWSSELIEHIARTKDTSGQNIIYDSGPICYKDLENYADMDNYRKSDNLDDRYFVKGLSYKNQNEWRVIIDGEKEALVANCGTGFILKTYPFQVSRLMTTEELLNGEIKIGKEEQDRT